MSADPAHPTRVEPLRVIEAYEEARERGRGRRVQLQRLAAAYEAAGEWTAACELLRQLLADGDGSATTRIRLAGCLAKVGRVPFELHRGVPVIRPTDEDVLKEAASHLEAAIATQPTRVTWMHKLAAHLARRRGLYELAMRTPGLAAKVNGRIARPANRLKRLVELGKMYESCGNLTSAAEAYRSALAHLKTVDAIWVHKAEPAWRFRLAYVEQQLESSAPADDRLRRSVEPSVADLDNPESPGDPAGFFEAQVTEAGLDISGFLVPGQADVVDIAVEREVVKGVVADSRPWLPTFHISISHGVLAELPERSRLSATAGGRALVSVGGARELEVRVPGGTGRLTGLLVAGYSISKKGSLARPPVEREKRQRKYLDAYDEAKDCFERLLGKRLFLVYGTLLGCYRDGAFIGGDDDFDVAYVSEATDPVDLKREAQQTALDLLRAGYDVGITVSGRLFKIRLDDMWLDINPFWFYRGRAWSFDTHDLDRAAIEPIKRMGFLGHEVYVPNDVEAFLEDNYGPGWRTPQPDFRYYRAEADGRILRRSWLTPSEARAFARLAEAERRGDPSVGQFLGISQPADAGFS